MTDEPQAECDHYKLVRPGDDDPWVCAECGAIDPARPKYEQAERGVELKACPFCGGAAGTQHIRDGRLAYCRSCGAEGAPCFHGPGGTPETDIRAIAAWNTRATIEVSEADRIDRLTAALAAAEDEIARLRGVVEAFVTQWNACGPNSDFGRHFQSVRDHAVAALGVGPT